MHGTAMRARRCSSARVPPPTSAPPSTPPSPRPPPPGPRRRDRDCAPASRRRRRRAAAAARPRARCVAAAAGGGVAAAAGAARRAGGGAARRAAAADEREEREALGLRLLATRGVHIHGLSHDAIMTMARALADEELAPAADDEPLPTLPPPPTEGRRRLGALAAPRRRRRRPTRWSGRGVPDLPRGARDDGDEAVRHRACPPCLEQWVSLRSSYATTLYSGSHEATCPICRTTVVARRSVDAADNIPAAAAAAPGAFEALAPPPRVEVPSDPLLCPITKRVLDDPVICGGDGQTYERAAIEEWLATHGTSPISAKRSTRRSSSRTTRSATTSSRSPSPRSARSRAPPPRAPRRAADGGGGRGGGGRAAPVGAAGAGAGERCLVMARESDR